MHCDVILPAEANRKAQELKARGEAAPTVENGKATAEALRLVAQEWVTAGPLAKDAYVLQQLRQLITAAATRVAQTQIGQINVVAGSDVEAYSALLASYPAAVSRVLEETGRAMGIDIHGILNGEGRSS